MPTRAGRPLRPIRRVVLTAVMYAAFNLVVGFAFQQEFGYILANSVILLLCSVVIGLLMYRKDIAAVVRARREG